MIGHLIAATLTGFIAVLVARLLRMSSARLRHAVLLAGLLGFAAPTPWLSRGGERLADCLRPSPATPLFEGLLVHVPLFAKPGRSVAAAGNAVPLGEAVWLAWAAATVLLLGVYLRRLLRPVPAVRQANLAETEALERAQAGLGVAPNVTLSIVSAGLAPGARGWRRPSVVLPDGLSEELSQTELRAVMAHELAHIERHDNLTAALARVIVAVFWFHPLVWWMERKLLAEREAACDERVLARGIDAGDYVSAILKVCRMSFAGPVTGYAGVTGSDLKTRMEQIMSVHAVRPPSFLLRSIPGAMVIVAALLPLGEGFVHAQTPQAATQSGTIHHGNDAALQKAYECWKQGKFPEAEDLYGQVYLADSEDSRGITGLVETYVSENRPEDAIALLKMQSAENPGRTDLRRMLGYVYARTEQYDLAIAEYQSLLDAEGNRSPEETAQLLYEMAETNRRKGDLNEALRWFRLAAASNSTDTKPLLAEALILDGTGRADQAAPVYEQILKLDPKQPVALNNLAYIVAQGGHDPDRALTLAQKAAQATKGSADIQDTLGWAYLKKDQPDEAAAAFRVALETNPNNPVFHYHLGLALLQMGQREAAAQELESALADHPLVQDERAIRELLDKIAP